MRELHVVAVSEDGRHIVLAGTKDATRGGFRVALDARLLAAVRGELPRPGEPEVRPSTLTPREIQDRLRAGESEEQIARSAGVPVTRVERFSGPVLSERVKVVESARAAVLVRGRRGPSAVPLGRAVDRHLAAMQGLKADSVSWSARRIEDGRWVVEVAYFSRGHSRVASWLYDPAARTVAATDPASAGLGHIDPAADKQVPDFDDEIPTAVRLRVSAPRPAAGGRVAPAPPAASPGPVVGAGKKAVVSGSTTRSALRAASRAAGRSDARVAGAPDAVQPPRAPRAQAGPPAARRVSARVGAAAARPGALPPRIGAGPSAVEAAGAGATSPAAPARPRAAAGRAAAGRAAAGRAAGSAGRAAGPAGRAAAAGPAAARPAVPASARAGGAKGAAARAAAPAASAPGAAGKPAKAGAAKASAAGRAAKAPSARAAGAADVPARAGAAVAKRAKRATSGKPARPSAEVTPDETAGLVDESVAPAAPPVIISDPVRSGPPQNADDHESDPAGATAEPAPVQQPARAPDSDLADAPGDDARGAPEAGTRPGGPPALRVVPPPPGSDEPQRPAARKSARGRASVPAWADVLLSTAPRHDDDEPSS